MVPSEPRKKSPATPPGIDPGTVRLVAQCLNHYATPGPDIQSILHKLYQKSGHYSPNHYNNICPISKVTNILIDAHGCKRKICFLLHCGNKRNVTHQIITEGYCDVTHPFVVASNKPINFSAKLNLNFEIKQDTQST